MSVELLNISKISKAFNGIQALTSISMSISKGEIVGLIGPNGAGKSTLFNVICGLIAPDSGKVLIKGKDITRIPPNCVSKLGIGRTFQNIRIVRKISAVENVLLFINNQPGEKLSKLFTCPSHCLREERQNFQIAYDLLKTVNLYPMANNLAGNLSYGQQKLLVFACCLAAKADLLLLDEPVSGVAPELINIVLDNIRELTLNNKSVIMIEHNLDAVMKSCDRLLFMDSGQINCQGSPIEVINDTRVIEAYIK